MTKTAVHRQEQKASTLWRCGGRACSSLEAERDEKIARHESSAQGPATAPPIVHDVLAAPGSALPPAVRRDAEHRLGHDFSAVRIHQGDDAARSAQAVSARAFTVGRHIVFGAGAFDPVSDEGRRVLLHELVHTLQQPRATRRSRADTMRASSPSDPAEREADAIADVATRRPVRAAPDAPTTGAAQRVSSVNPSGLLDDEVRTVSLTDEPTLHRDFALAPPAPAAVGRGLSAAEMASAIAFNQRVVAVVGLDGIAAIRDVLGVAAQPAVIDADFVNAVVRWQAVQRLTQDGQLGPASAGRLFREIGAEKAGRGELLTGPTYTPGGPFNPPVAGGNQQANFRFGATFKNDPANGVFASCCEARQFIRWDAASAAVLPGGIPHGGFPAGTPANTWIEDRDGANATRYGHRTGRFAESIPDNRYVDTNNRPNNAFGHIYQGGDGPGGPDALLAGTWRFMVRVIDVCNGNARLGDDSIRINW